MGILSKCLSEMNFWDVSCGWQSFSASWCSYFSFKQPKLQERLQRYQWTYNDQSFRYKIWNEDRRDSVQPLSGHNLRDFENSVTVWCSTLSRRYRSKCPIASQLVNYSQNLQSSLLGKLELGKSWPFYRIWRLAG